MNAFDRNSVEENFAEKEYDFAKELKDKLCDEDGKELDHRQSAQIIHQLGRLYQKRNDDMFSLIKSAALYNAAIARCPKNVEEIQKDLRSLCQEILIKADAKCKNPDCLFQISSKIKKDVENMRSKVNKKLLLIKPIHHDLHDESSELNEAEKNKIAVIKQLQSEIADYYTKIMVKVATYCEQKMGKSPCSFAIAGMGSLARKEITPFSDFEHIILLKDSAKTRKDYGDILRYFRWFSLLFHVVLINLRETIIPSVAISSLNDKSGILGDWFHDKFTTRGISFDGMMSHACKFPLGRRQLTERKKFVIELIQPVKDMLKFLSTEESLKNGYHLNDILTKTCFVYKDEKVFFEFQTAVFDFLEKKSKAAILKEVTTQVNKDLKKFATKPLFLNLVERHQNINIKQLIYRSTTLFISALGRAYNIRATSCFDIVTELSANKHFTEKMGHKLNYAVALACELRLRWYMQNKRQRDDVDSKQTLLTLVGKTSTIHYFQIAYSLQCHISKCWKLKKINLYSNPVLLNFALICFFDDPRDIVVSLKADHSRSNELLERFFDFEDCMTNLKITKTEKSQSQANLKLVEDWPQTTINAKIFQFLGNTLIEKNYFDDAILCFSTSTAMFQVENAQNYKDLDKQKEIGYNHQKMAGCYMKMANFAEAQTHFEQAMEAKPSFLTLSRLLYESAICSCFMNNLKKALQQFEQSYKFKSKISIDLEMDTRIGLILRGKGCCLKSIPERAKNCFEQALLIFQRTSDEEEYAKTLVEFSSLILSLGQYDKAKLLLEESFQLFQKSLKSRKDFNMMIVRCEIGNCCLFLKQLTEAEECFKMSLKFFEEQSFDADCDIRIAGVLLRIGKTLNEVNKPEKGLYHLEKALRIFHVPGQKA